MAKCHWCNCPYDEKQIVQCFTPYCSRACQQASKQNSKQKWNQFKGGLVETIQNQVLIAQQNALIAEQNRQFAAEEAERQRLQAIAERQSFLKQYLFDVNEGLDAEVRCGDEVLMVAYAEWFRFLCESKSFSDADLPEIGDKQYFAKTRCRCDAVRSEVSKQSYANFYNFKSLYSEYTNLYAGRSVSPEAEAAGIKKSPLTTKFNVPKPKLQNVTGRRIDQLIRIPEKLAELRRQRDWYVVGIVGAVLSSILCLGIPIFAVVYLYKHRLKPVNLARKPLEEKYQEDRKLAMQPLRLQLELEHQRELKGWERRRNKFEARLLEANREIEEHNSQVQLKYDTAQAKWLAEKQKMSNEINAFIDEHPSLEKWFQRL